MTSFKDGKFKIELVSFGNVLFESPYFSKLAPDIEITLSTYCFIWEINFKKFALKPLIAEKVTSLHLGHHNFDLSPFCNL